MTAPDRRATPAKDKKQRRRLRSLLAELDTGERNRLTKRAAKLRKAARRTQRPGSRQPDLEDCLLELVDEETGGGPETIAAGFAEFAPWAAQCRFRDCTHVHEPDCAVLRAVADGALPRSRYLSYRKLLGGDGGDACGGDGDA